jgi:orotidine-5'-phosphate decarboxylase
LNVHALGGRRMLEAAREAVEVATRPPLLIGVTMLTSHAQEELAQIGLTGTIADHVERLATETQAAGLNGVVCAATEVVRLRSRFGDGFKLVTPGIRPAGVAAEDQRRTMTPREAVQAGADYLVIGRPITRAGDPQAALRSVLEELSACA